MYAVTLDLFYGTFAKKKSFFNLFGAEKLIVSATTKL